MKLSEEKILSTKLGFIIDEYMVEKVGKEHVKGFINRNCLDFLTVEYFKSELDTLNSIQYIEIGDEVRIERYKSFLIELIDEMEDK